MKILGRAAVSAGLVGVCSLGMAMGGAVAAHAAGPSTILSGGGSDTTYFVMHGLDGLYNASQTTTSVTEIPPTNNTVLGFPASVTVPADASCPTASPWNADGSRTWDTSDAAHTPPNGSGAGILALQNDDASASPGCALDFARSSRGLGSGTDTPDLESYAFALDAVSWAIEAGPTPPKNKFAPTNLSRSQLQGIYTCNTSGPNTGAPVISNWAQVGGKNAAIIKYAPQTGSGTLSFFQTKLLNGSTVDAGCDASHLSHRAEENQAVNRCVNNDADCHEGTEPIPTGDYSTLIMPFSYAQWTSQKNHVKSGQADVRSGMKLEKVENVAPTAVTINEGTDPTKAHFIGTRYVFNILTQNEPQYAASAAYAGINQLTLTNGYLCSTAKATHTKVLAEEKVFGFTGLPSTVEGSGQPNGYCRFDPTPL